MKPDPEFPWLLIRKDRPPQQFKTREEAQLFYDRLRYNAGNQPNAALFGPNHEAWYCNAARSAEWVRDDERRKRERAAEDAAA